MTSPASLNARLRKVESSPGRRAPFERCAEIFAESDEDEAHQIAALEAAGAYSPGRDFLIAWRIVDLEPRSTPCRTRT